MGFAATLWEWYGQGEFKLALAVREAFPALEFLAMSANQQREAIPDCPACVVYSNAAVERYAYRVWQRIARRG